MKFAPSFSVETLNRCVYDDDVIHVPSSAPLQGAMTADVVVVGAGLTGLSAAWHLRERGYSVVVLEAHHIGFGASGRNGGQMNPGLKSSPADVKARFGERMGEQFCALAQNAPQALKDLIRRLNLDCELRECGTLKASSLPAPKKAKPSGDAVEQVLNPAELKLLTGSDYYRYGLFDPRGASVHPKKLLIEWAKQCRAHGVVVFENTRALRVIQSRDGYKCETQHGTVIGQRLVIATDGYTDHLWPHLAQSIVPIYSCMVASEPLDSVAQECVLPMRPVVYETQRMTIYYRIDSQNRLLMGGRGPQRALRSVEDVAPIIRHALTLWPRLNGIHFTHAWNGQFALTPDFYPRLHRPTSHVWAALGYSGRGVAMAVAMGQEIAKSIDGVADDDLAVPITPIKAIVGHPYWKWGVHFNVAKGRLLDALDHWTA
jgi:glycine/D-amino acid oxidase-like deaminating enzyme